jgi:hypothetical protein
MYIYKSDYHYNYNKNLQIIIKIIYNFLFVQSNLHFPKYIPNKIK